MIDEKIYAFRPKIIENFFLYFRKEKTNYVVKTRFNNLSYKIINETFWDIIQLCDGTRTIKKICIDLSNEYKIDLNEEIEEDVLNSIVKLIELNAIENIENPLIKTIKKTINNNCSIYYATYNKIEALEIFMKDDKNLFLYKNPYLFETELNSIAQASQALSTSQLQYFVFYFTKNSGEIIGLMRWSSLEFKNLTLDFIKISSKEIIFDISKVLKYSMIMVYDLVKQQNKIKFKVNILISDTAINECLIELGFMKNAFMEKEIYPGIDLIEYAYEL